MGSPSPKVNSAVRKGVVLLLAVAAWLVSCYAEMLLFDFFYNPSSEAPRLTYVAYAPWSIHGDLFSAVNHVGAALAIAALVALVIEAAKAILAAQGAFRCYLGALGFQVIVVWTAFQHSGWEWAEHLTSLVLTRGTREFHWFRGGTDPVWPWPPIAALLVLLVLTLFSWRERPVATETRPKPAALGWVGSRGNLAWLGMAWLFGALARLTTNLWFPPTGPWPHLANVAALPWDPAGEPQSTTVQLFGALFFAVLGVLLVEIVKATQIRRGRRAAYWPLLAFQVVLFCDVFASTAPDWAAYALASVLGVPVPVETFSGWPWISLLALGFLLLPELRRMKASRQHRRQPE